MSDGTDMAGCIGRQPASEMKRSEIELGQREEKQANASTEMKPVRAESRWRCEGATAHKRA